MSQQSNKQYYRKTFGVRAKVKSAVTKFFNGINKAYRGFCNFVKWVSCSVTLLMIPVCLGFIIYHTFICFNPVKAVVSCVVLWVVIDSNMKL